MGWIATQNRRMMGGLMGAGALCLVGVSALGARPDAVDAEFGKQKLKELNDDSVLVRDSATEALRAWSKSSPDRLLALITPACSAEQRERLLGLSREIFVKSPRGAMGVSFPPQALQLQPFARNAEDVFEEGIPIQSTIQGFDSCNVLRGGDLLRTVGGVRVRTAFQCRAQIVSYDPGQVVRLEIERDGRPLTVSVQLGSFNDLRPAERNALNDQLLQTAWNSRLARAASVWGEGVLPRPIDPLPGRLAWDEAERLSKDPGAPEARPAPNLVQVTDQLIFPNGPAQGDQFQIVRGEAPAPDLVATGESRTNIPKATALSQLSDRAGNQRALAASPEREQLVRMAIALRTQKTELQAKAREISKVVNDPTVAREVREANRNLLDSIEATIADVDVQIGQVRDAIRNR